MGVLCFIGENDPMYSTMRDCNENISGKYLQEAKQIFIDWHKSGNAGLSHEIFTACRISTRLSWLSIFAFWKVNVRSHRITFRMV